MSLAQPWQAIADAIDAGARVVSVEIADVPEFGWEWVIRITLCPLCYRETGVSRRCHECHKPAVNPRSESRKNP